MYGIALRFIAFCLLYATSVHAADTAPAPLVLAVHPYLSSSELQKRFAPLAAYLGKVMGRQVVIRVGRDYDDQINAIGTDSVDIAFIGPAPYTIMVSKYGQKPLLARIAPKGKPVLDGVIITSQDSPLRSVADLRGKRFAFGDPDSTMASLVPRYFLQKAGVPKTSLASYEHIASHKNVALGVLAGDYDAGAVKTEVFEEFKSRGLRILATLPTVPEHLFLTRSDMPPAQIRVLRKALLELKNEPDGPAIMQAIHKDMTEMSPVDDADYNDLRKMLTYLGIIRL
jgi:phosphonate transport system substrate-binding protein